MTYQDKYKLIITSIKDAVKDILPPGARVVLYGSRARGDFRSDSDWDFHILLPGESQLSFKEMEKYVFPIDMVGWSLGEAFSTSVYTYGDWEKRRFHPYYENVEKDKIILLS